MAHTSVSRNFLSMKKYWKWSFLLICLPFISCEKDPHINCIPGSVSTNCNCVKDTVYVCGCNNKTYINSCFANCDGVTFYTLGKCK